ncbi:hypothetical protein M408DRAFT_8946 [Serendipita vermifera MAFF 305830]|uniref:F-box domain-containing protein n=1 Tax=Serendipita vermifera MAFF 305830 TaxID=933852 RepID=A0A0C2WP12_SERVB|nr:hypothetical protein M408DRAFT_8946 [Serendipita vermifera MAFF 305830]
MSSNRPHAYHLPSDSEFAHTQLIISHRRDRIEHIDKTIEAEKTSLDIAIATLEDGFAPSIANIRAKIQRLIAEEEAKITQLNKERAATEEKLREASAKKVRKLELERAALDKEIGNDRGFIAPIRRLPSELLSEIFIWFEINGSPWPLTKVSRSWRSVALRTPQLWGQIIITESTGSIKSTYARPYGYSDFGRKLKTAPSEEQGREGAQRCKTVKGLETALKLAGTTPLRVVISIGNSDDYIYLGFDGVGAKKERVAMLNLLTQNFPRIQSLIIRNLPDLRRVDGADDFPSVFQGKLPNLQELEVNPTTRNAFTNALMASVQASSRNLKSLTYSQPSGLWGNMDVIINVNLGKESLSTLTSLRLGGSGLPFDKAVWESMVHLRELEFSGLPLTEWSAALLPSLTRLTISAGTATDLGGHFPRLKYLFLDSLTLTAPAFSITAPLLETLVLHGDHLEAARMLEAPVLESLEICSKFMKKAEANQLITTVWDDAGVEAGRCLNPKKLRIDVDANDGAVVKALKQMDRLEDLQLGIRSKMNVRRKVLGDLATIGKRNGKGVKEGVPTVCPNLKRLEVFPGQWTSRDRPMSGAGEKLQIQTLLNAITTARPGVECLLKEEEYADGLDLGDLFWAYD